MNKFSSTAPTTPSVSSDNPDLSTSTIGPTTASSESGLEKITLPDSTVLYVQTKPLTYSDALAECWKLTGGPLFGEIKSLGSAEYLVGALLVLQVSDAVWLGLEKNLESGLWRPLNGTDDMVYQQWVQIR